MVPSSSSSSSGTSRRNEEEITKKQMVELSSDMFAEAVDRYIDYNKPDPLCTKQLKEWTMEWTNSNNDDDDIGNQGSQKDDERKGRMSSSSVSTDARQAETSSTSSFEIQGTLNIANKFIALQLYVSCRWATSTSRVHPSSTTTQQQDHGTLHFSCHASARLITTNDDDEEEDNKLSVKESKKERKIRSQMISRFREDAYISKLLLLSSRKSSTQIDEDGSSSTSRHMSLLLAHADILFTPNELEERVAFSEDVCEGIKRAIWSSVESPLDVIDLIVNLPFLPTTTTNTTTTTTTTSLANRAKLRLLEDAMCDACEKEGEDELLDELQISGQKKNSPSTNQKKQKRQ